DAGTLIAPVDGTTEDAPDRVGGHAIEQRHARRHAEPQVEGGIVDGGIVGPCEARRRVRERQQRRERDERAPVVGQAPRGAGGAGAPAPRALPGCTPTRRPAPTRRTPARRRARTPPSPAQHWTRSRVGACRPLYLGETADHRARASLA